VASRSFSRSFRIRSEFSRIAVTLLNSTTSGKSSGMASTHGVHVVDGRERPRSDRTFHEVLDQGLRLGPSWPVWDLAFWLWKLGELSDVPEGIVEPYRLVIEGLTTAGAEMWSAIGCPYERAIALTHGDQTTQLEAIETLETLGVTAVVAKLRKTLRDQGLPVPRGKGLRTRTHPAGLAARQAEVLQLLNEGLSNTAVADRLFVSPRTVENHVSAVLAKLDSHTRQEAVARARAEGLLPDNGADTGP